MDLLTLNLTINDTFYRGVKYINKSTGERVAIDVGQYVIPAGCYPCSGENRCINVYRIFGCQEMQGCTWNYNDPGYGCESLMNPHENRTNTSSSYPSKGPMPTPSPTQVSTRPGGGSPGGGEPGKGGPSSFNTTIYDNMDLLTLNLTINDTFYRGVKYINKSTGERVAIDVGQYVIPAGCYPCSGENRCINVYRRSECQNMPSCNWNYNNPGYGCETSIDLTPSPTQVPTLNNTIAFGQTTWGEWGPLFSCPAESYVDGFRLRVDALVGKNFDDTALNTIEVHCSSNETGTSAEGDNGDWTPWKYCPEDSVAMGAVFKSVAELTTGGGVSGPDNTAGTDLNLKCSDFTVIRGNNGWNSGQWQSWDCPAFMAISGIRTQVESNCSSSCTGLNQVHFSCAPAPVGYFTLAKTEAPTSASIGEPTAASIGEPTAAQTPPSAHLEVVFRLAGDLTQSQVEKLNVAIANVLNIEDSDVIVISALWRASSTRRRRRMNDGYWEVEVKIYANEHGDLENIKTQLEENDRTIARVAAEMESTYGVDVTVWVESVAVRDNSVTTTDAGIGSLTIVIVLLCIGIVVLLCGLMYYRHNRNHKRRRVSRVAREIEDSWNDMGQTGTAAHGESEFDKGNNVYTPAGSNDPSMLGPIQTPYNQVEGNPTIDFDESKATTVVSAEKAVTVGEVELEETGHLLQEPNQDQNGATL